MPDYDGGCYFFTALVPVGRKTCKRDDGTVTTPVNALREALTVLPTARHSPATAGLSCVSPFSRNLRTHFARFAVLDDVTYSGRMPTNAIVAAVHNLNLTLPQPVDRLSCPYLIFVADVDAGSGAEAELDSWLHELWRDMEPELRSIFRWCVGFEAVESAEAFVRWMRRCQVATTMPFHDYWTGAPQLKAVSAGALLALAALSAGFVAWAVTAAGLGVLRALAGSPLPGPAWLAGAAVLVAGVSLGIAAAGAVAYAIVARGAAAPFPAAPDSDLPTVLKALYLQQRFTRFAIEAQGDDPEALHRRFSEFLDQHRPGEAAPTQPPGVVASAQAAG